MSTLKVDAIRHNSATSDAITTHSDGTASAKIIDVGGGQLSNRNLMINGAMNIAQRGTSSTAEGYTCDRFQVLFAGHDEAPTHAQVNVANGTTPYSLGFRKALKITNGNQTSGAGAGDYIITRYKIEAQDIANSGWNYTSSSSNITLSFWIKSSVAQNFYFNLVSADGSLQNYAIETGALSADTWTKVTKTIPGASNIQFDNDNGVGLQLDFWAYLGTNYTDASVTLNQWAAYVSSARMPNHPTTWYTTNDATLEFTGLQLEVGNTPTSFEHRKFGDELLTCQRYYEKSYPYGTAPGAASYFSSSFTRRDGTASSVVRYYDVNYKVTKRASPNITLYNPSTGASAGCRLDSGSYSAAVSSPEDSRMMVYSNTGSPPSHYGIFFHYTLDAEL